MYNDKIRGRLESLRAAMKREGIDYYLFVTADFHGSEYVCDYFKAREYFSGFNGSNGDLLVWKDGAALWTDGRYFLQASEQLEGTGIVLMKMGMKGVPTVEGFLEEHMLPGEKLGFDGRCIPLGRGRELEEVCEKAEKKACADAGNPVKAGIVLTDIAEGVWADRPALPANKAWLLSKENTGESRAERLSRVRADMKKKGARMLLLSSLDDIAWLFLLRGGDIDFNPVVLSYALICDNEAVLYVNRSVIPDEVRDELEKDGVELKDYDRIYSDLESPAGRSDADALSAGKSLIDPDRISYTLYNSLEKGSSKEDIIEDKCPVILMKSRKTPEETEFERKAHILDGAAVTKLIYRLHLLRESEEFKSGKKKVTELEVADILLGLRKEMEGFLDQSFAPIIATGAHGAIIHYEPDEKSNAVIEKDSFLLMDTGGQYMSGTTDITRTVMMGEASEEEKRLYTAVLVGNLRLADAVFPEGITGQNLDIIARMPLFELGADYRHGTGHGVGFLLNVHEGPQSINRSAAGRKLTAAFEEGMITSDEPGVYLDGKFGIRLENMMVCLPAHKLEKKSVSKMNPDYEADYGPFYGFETLTMVPFDRRSIDPDLMTDKDKELLNAYHEKVKDKITPYLTEEEAKWLSQETAPID